MKMHFRKPLLPAGFSWAGNPGRTSLAAGPNVFVAWLLGLAWRAASGRSGMAVRCAAGPGASWWHSDTWRRTAPSRLLLPLLVCLGGVGTLWGHECGPRVIELQVGQTCPWRITADLTEALTRYAPAVDGDQSVAQVQPLIPFMAHHGDFLITGRKPGTNTLSVAWGYEPTGAFGFCEVTIIVRPPDANNPPLDAPGRGGTLATSGLISITAEDLKNLLRHVPAESKKLLVFTQCFGGSIALSEGFRDMPNTAIASATSPNQLARYGGYDDDAARGLRPENGRTALDLHRDGLRGRSTALPAKDGTPQSKEFIFKNGEWPVTAGALPLESFSLAPVTADGPVKSRHVVFYAGQPEDKQLELSSEDGYTVNGLRNRMPVEVGDPAVRDRIKANFANQPNTTVRTVGGEPAAGNSVTGQNGWDFAGTYEGLERAIKEAGDAIRNSPDPTSEQFILYVGDHGGQELVLTATSVEVTANSGLTLSIGNLGFGSFAGLDYLTLDGANTPTIQLDATPAAGGGPGPQRLAAPGAEAPPALFELSVTPEGGRSLTLPAPEVVVIDIDDDGRIEPEDGDRYRLAYPFPEALLVGAGATSTFDLNLKNVSGQALVITSLGLYSGHLSKRAEFYTAAFFDRIQVVGPGRVRFEVSGAPGETYRLEHSEDLSTWTPLRQVRFDAESLSFEQDLPPATTRHFFRLVWESPELPPGL